MELKSQVLEEFCCKTKDVPQLVVHSMIASWAADIPETEGLLGAKRGTRTDFPYNIFKIPREKLHENASFVKRSSTETLSLNKNMFENKNQNNNMFEELIGKQSLTPAIPVFSDFPFVSIHYCVDIYNISHFEPIHFFFFEVEKMIKETVFHMVCDKTRRAPASSTTNNMEKHFRSIKSTVIRVNNKFLLDTEQ